MSAIFAQVADSSTNNTIWLILGVLLIICAVIWIVRR